MTKAEYQKKLAELEREADRCGCCVIPAEPLIDPDDATAAGSAALRRGRGPDEAGPSRKA